MGSSAFEKTVPVLATAEVLASVAYYRDVLGFEGVWYWRDGIGGSADPWPHKEAPDFAGACRGEVAVEFILDPELAAKVKGHMISFYVKGVDTLYEEHKAKGATFLYGLTDQPWGLREYKLEDPSGYRLRIGENKSD